MPSPLRRLVPARTAAVLATLVCLSAGARGQEFASYTSSADANTRRIEALEAELAALREGTGGVSFDGGGCDSSCGGGYCCDSCDACCCQPHGFYGGAAAVWVKPRFEDEVAAVLIESSLGGALQDSTFLHFDYDHDVTPRIWLGYTDCCGLGVRARYWQYDEDFRLDAALPTGGATNNSASVLITGAQDNVQFGVGFQTAAGGEPIVLSRRLQLDVFDVEATQQSSWCHTLFLASAGLRYVNLEQEYEFQSSGIGSSDLRHEHGFEGYGPTLALEAWRGLGCTRWSMYVNARASVLFGDGYQTAVAEFPSAGFTSTLADDDTLAIGELGLGLEYARPLSYGANMFLRFGWEGQYWHGAGTAISTDGDMSLEGFSVATGLSR